MREISEIDLLLTEANVNTDSSIKIQITTLKKYFQNHEVLRKVFSKYLNINSI